MSQIDFAVALLLVTTIITYSVVSVSSKLTNDFSLFTEKRLTEATSSLSSQLLGSQDGKSLLTSFRKVQCSFHEVGSYAHMQPIDITITPVVSKIHVYDSFLNEIPSTITNNVDNVTVTFSLDFASNEKKYVNIVYDDVQAASIAYTSPPNNVTSVILSGEDFPVLSQQKCSDFQTLSYDSFKNGFGFKEYVNISECDYGYLMPSSSNVIVKSVPILIERFDGTIYSDFVRIRVW